MDRRPANRTGAAAAGADPGPRDYPPGDTRAAAGVCLDALSRWGIEARAVCPPPEVRSFHADGVDNAAMPSVIGTLQVNPVADEEASSFRGGKMALRGGAAAAGHGHCG